MAYIRKTRDSWEVEGNYGFGHGWESVTAEETRVEAKKRLKEYRENDPSNPYRLRCHRERIDLSIQIKGAN